MQRGRAVWENGQVGEYRDLGLEEEEEEEEVVVVVMMMRFVVDYCYPVLNVLCLQLSLMCVCVGER